MATRIRARANSPPSSKRIEGVDAAACVALEDSSVGVRAAHAARMLTIMVPDLHQPNAETAALAHYVMPDTRRAARVVLALFDALGAHAR